jgi:transcriptional regulator with PAS, ATPase and Fis domain
MLEGKPIHQQNTAYPVVNEDGRVIGSVDIFTSADSKKTLARSNPPSQTFSLTAKPLLIGSSPAMTKLLEIASGYADYPHCVLVLGESGTGKEMIAQYIHKTGARSEMPFVTLNCANLMDTLIDSELFGYDEGAYTGSAKGGKKGKFQLAHRGTLFLDEIGELPLHLQAKLLRAIETKQISRLGSEDTISVDVRIIAATNRPLAQMVREGSFREDLFYRLNVLNLKIPPLRERKEDIPLLVGHFMEKYHVESTRKNAMTELVNSEIQNYLSDYEWPGNIRELENLIIRFIVLSGKNNTRIIDLLGYANRPDDSGGNEIPKRRETYISKEELTHIMNQCKGNKREASKLLGVGRSTLYRYLTKYGM